jgi:anti-sigma factor RsiW
MSDCASIDPLVTPYVDGELTAAEREAVQRHLRACAPCHARVTAEQAVHGLLAARKDALHVERAPEALRAKCGTLLLPGSQPGVRGARRLRGPWFAGSGRTRLAPLALAATLVLIVAGAFLYQLTARSSRLMAAELTADHVKCFALNGLLGTHQESAAVESALASGFGWQAHLPESPGREGLELVGSRPCLYGAGRVAHIMYRHNGRPVSLFMLPRSAGTDRVVSVLGHEATIWSVGDRTFVLVAREEKSAVARLASFVRTSVW